MYLNPMAIIDCIMEENHRTQIASDSNAHMKRSNVSHFRAIRGEMNVTLVTEMFITNNGALTPRPHLLHETSLERSPLSNDGLRVGMLTWTAFPICPIYIIALPVPFNTEFGRACLTPMLVSIVKAK